MRRFSVPALAAALLLVAPAAAATTHTDTVRASVHKTGRSGTALVYKGTVRSKVFGRGSVVEKIYGNLKGTFALTSNRGEVRGSTAAHPRSGSGGRLNVSGTSRLTGGTGRYRHVSGHGTFTGSSSPHLSRARFRPHRRGRLCGAPKAGRCPWAGRTAAARRARRSPARPACAASRR